MSPEESRELAGKLLERLSEADYKPGKCLRLVEHALIKAHIDGESCQAQRTIEYLTGVMHAEAARPPGFKIEAAMSVRKGGSV